MSLYTENTNIDDNSNQHTKVLTEDKVPSVNYVSTFDTNIQLLSIKRNMKYVNASNLQFK